MSELKILESDTPLLRQFKKLKAQAGSALLLFRMGDFYELFGDDAKVAAKILEITLTSRDKNKENALPMAGIPHHASQNYISKLLDAGYQVAIAEQHEVPGNGTKILERKIVRTLSPAVQFEQEGLERRLLVTFSLEEAGYQFFGIDPSTGETIVHGPLTEYELRQMIGQREVRHVLVPELGSDLDLPTLEGQLQENISIDAPKDLNAAVLIFREYLSRTVGLRDFSSNASTFKTEDKILRLGASTAEHLDLKRLLDRLRMTQTAMGGRLLRHYLESPLCSLSALQDRQEKVRALHKNPTHVLKKAQDHLSGIYDLPRILQRLQAGLIRPKDLLSWCSSVETAFTFLQHPLWNNDHLKGEQRSLESVLGNLRPHTKELLPFLENPAPLHTRDGKIFKEGFDSELDELTKLSQEGQSWLSQYEGQLRAETQISSLKIKFNRVFGYRIEVTSSHLNKVPSTFERKQTVAGGERFLTAELRAFEERFLKADPLRIERERTLYSDQVEKLIPLIPYLQHLSEKIAEIDVYINFALILKQPGWILPELKPTGHPLIIEEGKHPWLEDGRKHVVSNSVEIGGSSAPLAYLITGPNMGGKSTFLRQIGLQVLLSQAGAPIPATRATVGLFHSIHSRIGAYDRLENQQSTFFVEMSELGQIIHQADQNSLVLLDEIGRGTSTFDGMSVAASSLEYFVTQSKCKILFATHYHELTQLSKTYPEIKNFHVKAEQSAKGLRFLYKIEPGFSDKSFGIDVAKMAGIPDSICKRATEYLDALQAPGLTQTIQNPSRRFTEGNLRIRNRNPAPSETLGLFDHLL